MSSYAVVRATSEALRRILWEQYNGDDVIRPIVGSESAIVFKNPTDTARDSGNRLSLWLYQITENEFVKNQPMLHRREQPGTQFPPQELKDFPPLALNLFYLVTPFAPSGEADHLLLGKTMQVMYDNAVLLLRDTTSQISEELRIIFCRLSLEELTRIWEALKESYRLSICYEVRVTRVDSGRSSQPGRVIERFGDFDTDVERLNEIIV